MLRLNNCTRGMKKNIVVIGGGNGSASVLKALVPFTAHYNVAAVISVADSGGSSGKLRREFNSLPTGDILRAIIALSEHDSELLNQVLYKNRFSGQEKLSGHNIGNLFLTLVARYANNFVAAIRALEEALGATGRVHPVSLEPTHLVARLSSGEVVVTEEKIDRPNSSREHQIESVWLDPEVTLHHDAKEAIVTADYVFLALGSLYTSVVATLLPQGVRDSLASSPARLVSVHAHAYELDGENGPNTLSGQVRALECYLPRPLDMIVYNDVVLQPNQKSSYEQRNWGELLVDAHLLSDRHVIRQDFEHETAGMDSEKLSFILGKHVLGICR